MISPCGHDRCVHKGHHSCLPTLRPDGSGMTLTRDLHYSLQSNRKTEEGSDRSDSRCAVSAHQLRSEVIPAARHCCDFGRHQKESTRWNYENKGRQWLPVSNRA